MTRILCLALLCLALLATACDDADPTADAGNDDVLDTAADDTGTNPGDTTTPLDTSTTAQDTAEPGDTVLADTAPLDTTDDADTSTPVAMAASVTQYGITWTFDREVPVGQFVTGDWWVVGPVTVTAISPAPTGTRNGSMLDPVGAQGYDARAGRYDESVAVALPLAIEPGHSLVSSISHPDAPGCQQGGADAWPTYTGECQRGPIETQAVLTVLAEVAPDDAFRPPYAPGDKPLHRVSDLCWQRLPALTAPDGFPGSGDDLLRHVERPWIDHLNSWTMQHGCATQNMFCYGREIGNVVSTLAAAVLVDSSFQRDLAIRLVQLGIDNFGVHEAGGGWGADGGHFNGRKFPIVFAGGLLGSAAMMSPGSERLGNEDAMTSFGADGTTALWGRACSACYLEAGCSYEGSCTNGAKDCRDPEGVVDGCEDYRNCCTSGTWVGEALAIRQMGLEEAWGHPAFFAYVERWMAGDVPGGGGTSGDLVTELWHAWHEAAPQGMRCE